MPVRQCDECEYLYCGAPDRCLTGITECKNPECPKSSNEFTFSKCGRIIRNAFSTFEFKNTKEDEDEPIKYENKNKVVVKEFKER